MGITYLVVDCNGSDVEFVDSDFVDVGGICVVGDENMAIVFVVDCGVVVDSFTIAFVVDVVPAREIKSMPETRL